MAWQYHPLLLLFFVGGILASGIAVYSWLYVRRHGFSYLVGGIGLLGVHDSVWAFAAALKTASTEVAPKLLFYKLEFLGSWAAPSLTVVIALAFIGWDHWLTRRTLATLAAVPVVGVVLVVLNPGQVMIVDPVLVRAGGIVAFEHSFPPLFVLFLAWSMGLAALAAVLMGYGGLRRIVPWQPALLGMLVFLLPLFVLSMKTAGIYPPNGRGINLTPAANAVALGLLSATIINYRIFELLPVGRHQAVEVMNDGYLLVGPDETVLDANRAAADLLGETSDGTVTGAPVYDVLPGHDRVTRAGEATEVLVGIDGRTIEVRASAVTRQHQTAGRLLLLRDVTAQRERERELETANERLDRFASVVAHDLRNPLNVAQARLDLLREECESEHLGPAVAALERMETIIRDVLTLARLGTSVSAPEPVSLSWAADNAWDVVDATEATLALEDDRVLLADASRLRRILENLFRNSVEHGASDVTVRVGAIRDGSGFYVADDGVGVPESERESVFESGYSTTTEGTGLGLSIVEEIVEAHGWEIRVLESSEGGARFEVTGVEFVE
jgi:signal transduction histidine kinase